MDLEGPRKRIDEIDAEVARLLSERGELAVEVGRIKAEHSVRVYNPQRELQVLENVARNASGPLGREAIERIYREVISACRALEDRPIIAHFGAPASFTHMAAVRSFGSDCDFVALDDMPDVFTTVEKGAAQYGVVPVENSTGGVVPQTIDRFIESPLRIVGERYMDIHHYLCSKGSLEEIKRVYTHPQVFAQCQRWLREHLSGSERYEESSSSRGAERASHEGPGAAAIATPLAAEIYGLDIIAERIEDYTLNRTRFWVIGKDENPPTGRDKTSILFTTRHVAGSLIRALEVFDRHQINLTMIQSRPIKGAAWEYVFFIDLQGHPEDDLISGALRDLDTVTLFYRVLGAYREEE